MCTALDAKVLEVVVEIAATTFYFTTIQLKGFEGDDDAANAEALVRAKSANLADCEEVGSNRAYSIAEL
jgi:hypothetical protein